MRLIGLFILICCIVTVPFIIWGDWFDSLFGENGVETLKSYGDWAWLAGLGLLVFDLILPVPATAVMGALGVIYGSLIGGLIGSLGSVTAGIVAYWLCRLLGRPVALKISGEVEMERVSSFNGNKQGLVHSGIAVAVSRWLPVFPEALACMAGLVRMPFSVFLLALICGSVPLSFVYAGLGSYLGASAIVICALLPLALFLPASWIVRRKASVQSSNEPRA